MSAQPDAADRRLLAFLADGPDHGPEAGFVRAMTLTRAARQRPGWSIPAWWLPDPMRPQMVGIAVMVSLVLLAVLALAIGLVGGQRKAVVPPAPSPTAAADALPPASIHLEMVLRNDQLGRADYLVVGSPDGSGGDFGPCIVGRSDFDLSGGWVVSVHGQRVLGFRHPSPAYADLPDGGTVTLAVRVTPDGEVVVEDLVAGSMADSIGFDAPRPETCSQIGPDPSTPEAFRNYWDAAGYRITLLGGWALRMGEPQTGQEELIQGWIDEVDGDRVTFRSSFVCPDGATYRWTMSPDKSSLTLTPVDDPCQARRELLATEPLVRYPHDDLLPGARYVLGDFDPPIAFTLPSIPGDRTSAGEGGASSMYVDVTGQSGPGGSAPSRLGIEVLTGSNVTPATCKGRQNSRVSGEPDGSRPIDPVEIRTLDAFQSAFTAWDPPGVIVSEPRELVISGRPAVAIDVVVDPNCTFREPVFRVGDVLERVFAIDLGDRLLFVSIGPRVYNPDLFVDPDASSQTDNAELLEFGEQLVRSIELLPDS